MSARLTADDEEAPQADHEALARRDPRAGQRIDEHKFHLTLFEDERGQQLWFKEFTLPELAMLVRTPIVKEGIRLRLLKLVQFGPTQDVTGSLCTSANAQQITGLEARYVGDEISPVQAVEIMLGARVRCVIYAVPGGDGWTILLPLSRPRGRQVRELFMARVNGLFGGKLTPESFAVQQPVAFSDDCHSKMIEGEFLDIDDRTYAGSIFRDGSTVMDRYHREQALARSAKASKVRGKVKDEIKGRDKARVDGTVPPEPVTTAEVFNLNAVRDRNSDADTLTFTEMSPEDGRYAGKQIMSDGFVKQYPQAYLWNWATVQIPATMVALFDTLKSMQRRNVCLIRGVAKEGLEYPARRLKENFLDEPSRLQFFDIDGHEGEWQADPEAAVKGIVAQFGEPWASASYVWFFSGTHGLKVHTEKTGKLDKHGKEIIKQYWRGEIVDGKIKVRLAFILERAVDAIEAENLTKLLSISSDIKLDPCVSRQIQPNYTARIKWHAKPDHDVLGDHLKIGWVKGAREFVDLPEVTTTEVKWARAEGRGAASSTIADHPDAVTAVCAIGCNGQIREHMMAAVVHLLKANPKPPDVEVYDHAVDIADKLRDLIGLHRDKVSASLDAGKRDWGSVWGYLPDNMADWAVWAIQKNFQLGRKTIQLTFQPRTACNAATDHRQAIVDRVRRTVHEAGPGVTLLIAPTGTFKSTEVRKAAVEYVVAHPGRTVVILVPRHDLGAEQIRKLSEEHPDADFTAAVWRGRFREDPEFIGPSQPKKPKLMCWRADEAQELEEHLVDVNSHLCQRGRGKDKVRCPLFDYCGVQRQRHTKANIWIGAHELITHEMPEAFGNVGRIYVDEDPLDAFVFGTNGEVKIRLGALTRTPKHTSVETTARLTTGRRKLHGILTAIEPPENEYLGAPVTREMLSEIVWSEALDAKAERDAKAATQDDPPAAPPDIFASYGDDSENDALSWERFITALGATTTVCGYSTSTIATRMARLEWHDKIEPPIRPDMPREQVRELLVTARGNAMVRKMVLLWLQLGFSGRVQVYVDEEGDRTINVMGLRPVAKEWRGIPILITDATADATLLRTIWPELRCEVEEWEQLPRPASVRVFQCVDRSLSMDNIAVFGEDEALWKRENAARRMWGALLVKAFEYGGQPVGVILYKSTEDWIRKNCFVPDSITILHHGGVAGVNVLEKVRALFVVGRLLPSAEAVTRSTEALTGEYLPKRSYERQKKAGKIAITANARGQNTVLTDIWVHPHPIAERLRRQVMEASANQNEGRARASLRDDTTPLDIHRWHDVALPELGEAEPVLWDEIKVGLDELMLTGKDTAVWLKNTIHAEKAHPDLLTARALEKARQRTAYAPAPSLLHFSYQLVGVGQKPTSGASLLGEAAARAFLADRLGPLAWFEVERPDEAEAAE